jgi:phenylacetate-CoA ligase
VDCESLELLPDGQTGSLLLTDLFNDVTPFIRYEIGDMGAIEWRDCTCGISGWCISNLAGRVAWMIKLPSGRRISSYAFNAMVNFLPALHQWKVARLGPAEFEVQHTGDELNDADRQELLRMLDIALEGANIRIVRVAEIDRTPTGKLLQYEDLTGTDTGASKQIQPDH